MAESFVIPLGTAGLVLADLGCRFYRDGVADTGGVAAGLTVAELAGADYRISGLPDVGAGSWFTLTGEYPAGVGWSYTYPAQDGAPPNLILPVRETGLVAADFDFALYKDGVARADVLTTAEVGSPGDYRVAGWPTDEAGAWLLVWRRNGISWSQSWTVPAAAGSVTGWSTRDYQKVAAVLSTGTFTTLTPAFRGVFDPNAEIEPAPRPSGVPRNPTVFAVWDIAYSGDVSATFDEDDEPVREGLIVFAVWSQKGATRGHALNLFEQLRARFTGADGGGVVFFPRDAVPRPLEYRGEWAVEVLPIPFTGGVSA